MAYNRINWENDPSTATPLNETNLNKMDKAIYDLDREKMNNVNPSGTGKFSINRKIGSTEGTDSVAIGPDSVASTTNSMAFGLGCESNNENQVITGVYPTKNISNAVFAVGCGKNDSLRLTAFWVTSSGELKSNYNITGKVGGNDISLASLQAGKQNVLTFDNVPTDGSNNPVRSNGIYDALAEKADKNGFINGSMKLVTDATVIEKVPYNLRSSGGKVGAVCQNTDKIVGGTIAWNQIFTNGNFADTSGWSKNYSATQFSVSGNVGTVVTDRQDGGIFMNIAVKANHKYFFSFEIKNTDKVKIGFAYISGGRTLIDSANTSFVRYTQVGQFSADGSQACCFYSNVATANTLNIRNCMIVDLTQLMNDVISDKDTFLSLFPNTYYAYNTGTLMSVNTSAHKMRNADDEVICDVALDSSLTLKGIYKLDANNDIYCDGDTYESDGTVTRKWLEVTYDGSDDENWSFLGSGSASAYAMQIAPPSNAKVPDGNEIAIISNYLQSVPRSATWGNYSSFISISANSQIVTGINTITSVSAWRTYLSSNPLTVVYKLATATTETATAYTNPQIVDGNGTEEYVDYAYSQNTRDVKVPVGHESQYAQAMDLPTIPTTDGAYALTATSSGGIVSFSWEATNSNRSASLSNSNLATENIRTDVPGESEER